MLSAGQNADVWLWVAAVAFVAVTGVAALSGYRLGPFDDRRTSGRLRLLLLVGAGVVLPAALLAVLLM